MTTHVLNPNEVANAKDAEIVEESAPDKGETPLEGRVKPPLTPKNENDPEEVAADEAAESQMAPPPAVDKPVVKQIPVPEAEYAILAQSINGLNEMKKILIARPNPELAAQVNLTEASIWDTVVKKFGFPNMESAQQQGLTFSLRTIRVVECKARQ